MGQWKLKTRIGTLRDPGGAVFVIRGPVS